MTNHKLIKVLTSLHLVAFLLLSFFPILKSNHSSILLIFFLVSAAFLYRKEFRQRFKSTVIKKAILYTGTYLTLVISLLYSENLKEGTDRIIQFIPLFAVPVVLIYFNPKEIKKVVPLFLSLFLIINIIYAGILINYLADNYIKDTTKGFIEIIRILYQSNFNTAIWHSEQVTDSDILLHKAYMSMSFLMSFCIAASRILKSSFRKIQYWIYLLQMVFFSLMIIYLLSIPNILGLLLCAIFIVIFNYSRIGKYEVIALCLLLVCLSTVGYYYITVKEADNKDISRGINFIKSTVSFSGTEYNDPRVELYKSAWPIIKKNPIFGVGLGDTQDRFNEVHIERLNNDQANSKNILKLGEEFDHDIWFKRNAKVVKNTMMAPDKSFTADKITDDEVNSGHNISQSFDFKDKQTYSFSVYAKSLGCDYLILRLGNISSQRVSFNLKNTTIDYRGNLIKQANIQDVGDGWHRFFITVDVEGKQLILIGTATKSRAYNYVGQGNSIILWGAQLEKGSLTNYKKNNTELLQYAIEEDLNTHNNYLYFYMSGGLVCLLLFVISLTDLGWQSIRRKSFLPLAFITIFMINLLSENMLSRHFGLMFFSIFLITLFIEYFEIKEV